MSSSPSSRAAWREPVLSFVLCLAVALLAMGQVLTHGGAWPQNHEGGSAFERTEWFRLAYAAGDWLPTWSPFCFRGHGTPGPFFYHRLFYTFSGVVAWLTGSDFWAVASVLVLVLALGGWGVTRLGRDLGWPVPLRLVAGALLILAPYTYTNWLVRCAVAELTAAMLLPWLFLYALRLIRGERRTVWGLGVVFALMFYGHIVIWLYAAGVVALAFVLAAGWRWRELRERGVRAPLVLSALATVAMVLVANGLYAWALQRLGKSFSLDQLSMYYPTREYRPLLSYAWDSEYHWGQTWRGLSVEVGRGLLLGLGALALLAGAAWARVDKACVLFMGLILAGCVLLQLPLSAPFYEHVPFVALIQFPWRLLSFATPALIILLAELAAGLLRTGGAWRFPAWAGVAAVMGWQLVFAVDASHINYEWIEPGKLEWKTHELDAPWSGGEYLPRGMFSHSVPPRTPFISLDGGCHLVRSTPERDLSRAFHFTRIALDIESSGNCRVHFSQFAGPFIAVEGVEPGAVGTWMGTLVVTLDPGPHRLIFRRRGVLDALWTDLRRGRAR